MAPAVAMDRRVDLIVTASETVLYRRIKKEIQVSLSPSPSYVILVQHVITRELTHRSDLQMIPASRRAEDGDDDALSSSHSFIDRRRRRAKKD